MTIYTLNAIVKNDWFVTSKLEYLPILHEVSIDSELYVLPKGVTWVKRRAAFVHTCIARGVRAGGRMKKYVHWHAKDHGSIRMAYIACMQELFDQGFFEFDMLYVFGDNRRGRPEVKTILFERAITLPIGISLYLNDNRGRFATRGSFSASLPCPVGICDDLPSKKTLSFTKQNMLSQLASVNKARHDRIELIRSRSKALMAEYKIKNSPH